MCVYVGTGNTFFVLTLLFALKIQLVYTNIPFPRIFGYDSTPSQSKTQKIRNWILIGCFRFYDEISAMRSKERKRELLYAISQPPLTRTALQMLFNEQSIKMARLYHDKDAYKILM